MNNTVSHIEKLSLDLLSMGFPSLILFILAGSAFAIWYYHDTVPPVSGSLRWALTALRAAAFSLLFIALAEPVVEILRTSEKRSKTAVLIDTSSSMDQGRGSGRKSVTLEIIDTIKKSLGDDALFFGFDSGVYPLGQQVPEFDGAGTDILTAITEAKNTRDVSSILLVSDGRWNLGEDPRGSNLPADIPVSTVTVGTDDTERDIAVNKISAATVGRDGESLGAEIILSSANDILGAVPVRIEENGRTLAAGNAVFENSRAARVDFEIPLESAGDHAYSVIIDPGDDAYSENNTRIFDVHVIKSSYRVLIAADKPSADLAFLRRLIESESRYELDVVIDSGTSGSLSPAFPGDVSVYDAVILLNWGGSAVTSRNAVKLKERISSGGGLWILGSSGPSRGADEIRAILPTILPDGTAVTETEKMSETPHSIQLTENGILHFITSQGAGSEREWNILPPLRSVLPVLNISPDGRLLAETVVENLGNSGNSGTSEARPLPVIVTGKHGTGKIVVMPVSGIWRWQLMMEGAGKGGGFYRNFVSGTLGWLTSETDISPLNVTTDRGTYLGGQEINFEARLYDAVYSPVGGAEITVEIDSDPESKIILRETRPSFYTGTLRSIGSGEHVFSATAYLDGRLFAERAGEFSVQDFSLELLDSTVDRELMLAVAERTGGLNVSPAGIDSAFVWINSEIITERSESRHNIYLNPVMPVLIVLLFTVEWSVRKFRGMI